MNKDEMGEECNRHCGLEKCRQNFSRKTRRKENMPQVIMT
jgi:hypothetical protein